jgi:hypothetical protein
MRLLILFSAIALTARVTAQQGPARDASGKTGGSSIVRGRVVADESDRPLSRARVTLQPETDLRIDPVFTDAEGRFAFSALAAGRYTIAVTKTGYVWGRLGRHEIDRSTSFTLSDRQAVEDLDVRLLRAAAIAGRIVDEFGDPVLAASVQVGSLQRVNGELRFVATRGGLTDDRGDFRVGGLPAGTYIVAVPGDSAGRPLPGAPEEWRRSVGWTQIYYPAAADPSLAQRIPLKIGEEISSVDIILRGGTTGGRLTVIATDVSGNPATGSVRLVNRNGAQALRLQQGRARSALLTPGEWTVEVQGTTGAALTRLTMGSTDLEVSMVLGNAGRLSGRVSIDDPRVDLKAAPIDLRLQAREFQGVLSVSPPIRIERDGTFEAVNLLGRRRITLLSAPRGWALRSVMHDGRSLLDAPIDFIGGEDLTDVEIRLTTETREISGVTVDARHQPAVGCFALVFPDDPQAIQSGRLTRRVRSDLDGRFSFAGLTNGEYFVTARASLDPTEWSSPEFLSSLRSEAARITLSGISRTDLSLDCRGRP